MALNDCVILYAKDAGLPEKIEMTYKNGHGHFTIKTSSLLPCSQKDFKVFMGMLDSAENRDEIIDTIQNYISLAVRILAKWREHEEGRRDTKEIAKHNALIKKYTDLSGLLAKSYGVEPITDREKLTFKKSEVYAIEKNEIVFSMGWIFEKEGLTFTAYKTEKGNYSVIVPSMGLSCGYVSTKQQIDALLSADLMGKIKKILSGNTEKAEKHFSDLMKEAGFYASYCTRSELAPISKEEKPQEIQTEKPEIITEKPEIQTEAEKPETVQESPEKSEEKPIKYVFLIYTDWNVYAGRLSEEIIAAVNDTEAQKIAMEKAQGKAFSCNRLYSPETDAPEKTQAHKPEKTVLQSQAGKSTTRTRKAVKSKNTLAFAIRFYINLERCKASPVRKSLETVRQARRHTQARIAFQDFRNRKLTAGRSRFQFVPGVSPPLAKCNL